MGLGGIVSGASGSLSSGISAAKDWLGGGDDEKKDEGPWAGIVHPNIEKKDLPYLDTNIQLTDNARTVPEGRPEHGEREEGKKDAKGNPIWHRESKKMTSTYTGGKPREMIEAKDLPYLNTNVKFTDSARTVPENRPSHRTNESTEDEDGKSTWSRSKQKYIPPKAAKSVRVSYPQTKSITEFISVAGTRYKFSYNKPSASEVDDLADKYSEDPDYNSVGEGLTADDRKNLLWGIAYEKLLSKARDSAYSKAKAILTNFYEKLENSKVESGISRRSDFELEGQAYRIEYVDGNEDNFVKPVDQKDLFETNGWTLTKGKTSKYKSDSGELPNLKETTDTDVSESFDKMADEIEHLIVRRRNRKRADSRETPKTRRFDDVRIFSKDDSRNISFGDSVVEPSAAYFASKFGGFGSPSKQLYEYLHSLEMFGNSFVPQPRELKGYTFITRPHLNLTNTNLAHISRLTHILQAENTSTSMYIRQMLDTAYSDKYGKSGGSRYCPLIDNSNPFNVLLGNSLLSINGFPDPDLSTETTSGGFFSEQQTNVIGYNRLAKGQDLQIEFKDIEGGLVLAMHDVWCQYIGYISDGEMMQYLDDIEDNIMGYTVSIYRFVTDHTGRYITRWAKATGCYPKLYPAGTPFNINEAEKVIQATKRLTVPYWCHHFDYNNPDILMDFNELVCTFCKDIDKRVPVYPKILNDHSSGIPYIAQRDGRFEIQFRVDKSLTYRSDPEIIDSGKAVKDPDNMYLSGFTSATNFL